MSSPQRPPQAADPAAAATAQHQAAQIGLTAALGAELASLWASLDLADLRGSLPTFTAAVALRVQQHARASATLATRHYATQRKVAGVVGRFTPRPASPPPVSQIASTVSWATQPLWTSNPTSPPPSGGPSPLQQAQQRLSGATQRLVTGTGTTTTVANVKADPKAKGYARQPEPNACSFCLMLASRGAVYKQDRAGGRGDSFAASNRKFRGDLNDPSTIKVHDHCHCQPAPFWGSYEPSPEVDAAERLWVESTHGLSGHAAQVAFRRAVEGRTAPPK